MGLEASKWWVQDDENPENQCFRFGALLLLGVAIAAFAMSHFVADPIIGQVCMWTGVVCITGFGCLLLPWAIHFRSDYKTAAMRDQQAQERLFGGKATFYTFLFSTIVLGAAIFSQWGIMLPVTKGLFGFFGAVSLIGLITSACAGSYFRPLPVAVPQKNLNHDAINDDIHNEEFEANPVSKEPFGDSLEWAW